MGAYEFIMKQIHDGVQSIVIAMRAIFLYFISTGKLTQNNMSAENLTAVMTLLGYSYNTGTDTFNDGTTDYSIYELLQMVIENYYVPHVLPDTGTMILTILSFQNKEKITAEQAATLKEML